MNNYVKLYICIEIFHVCKSNLSKFEMFFFYIESFGLAGVFVFLIIVYNANTKYFFFGTIPYSVSKMKSYHNMPNSFVGKMVKVKLLHKPTERELNFIIFLCLVESGL